MAVIDDNGTSDSSVVKNKWLSDEKKLEDEDYDEVITSKVVNWCVKYFY